jgi:predicted  nucleic acid-binding Zn-ribbon protein
MYDDQNDNKDDGSIWTSYSDLFTTVAIIFLVMFVFALIKAGVSTVQTVQQKKIHEQELKGKIDPSLKKKTDQKIADVEKTIDDMKNYDEIISQKVQDLTDFAKKMQLNKQVMHDILEDQKRKDAILQNVQEKLVEKEKSAQELVLQKNNLENQINQTEEMLQQLAQEKEVNHKKIAELSQELIKTEQKSKSEVDSVRTAMQNAEMMFQQKIENVLKDKRLNEQQSQTALKELEKNKLHVEQQFQLQLSEIQQKMQQTRQLSEQEISKVRTEYNHLQTQLENKNDALTNLETNLEDFKQKISQREKIIKDLEQQKREQDHKIQSLSQSTLKNESMIEKLRQLNTQYATELNQIKQRESDLSRAVASMENQKDNQASQLQQMQGTIEQLNREVAEQEVALRNEEMKNQQKLLGLESLNQTLLAKIQALQQNAVSKHDNLSKLKAENEHLKQLANNQSKVSQQEFDQIKTQAMLAQKEKERLARENGDLKHAVKDIAKKVTDVKSQIRGNIAKKLAGLFQKANIAAKVDPATGNVTLDLGKNFLFQKNSAKLSNGAKEQLKKIIPIYSDVLLSDAKISDQISSFNIEGHASPLWNNAYVAPDALNPKAYSFNMGISSRRATSISTFLFGKTIGDYQHKTILKNKTRAVGYGHTKPIEFFGNKKRSIASQNQCFPFDCALSQRVELSFTLKDDDESLKKLLNISLEVP